MDINIIEEVIANANGQMMSYGPSNGGDIKEQASGQADSNIQIVESFGSYEAEYAAIKRHVGIMHQPQRGLVKLSGTGRQSFLHNLLTQDIKILKADDTTRSFLINSKGRLLADLLVHHRADDTLLETDIFDVKALIKFLDSRLFAEDVQIENLTDKYTAIALHGPASQPLINSILVDSDDITSVLEDETTHYSADRDGNQAIIYRQDECAIMGIKILITKDGAGLVFNQLLQSAGFNGNVETDNVDTEQRRSSLRGRPVGWLAYNTARIEAGTPLFHIDFSGDSLPAETGIMDKAVSFTKGCYPGQEIVARMQNLGHPARTLVGLKFNNGKMPVAGGQVFKHIENENSENNTESNVSVSGAKQRNKTMSQKVVGGITSSCLSPLLGNVPIALGLVKWGEHEKGNKVDVMCEDEIRIGTVGPLKSI